MNAFQLLKCGTTFKKDSRNEKAQKHFKPAEAKQQPPTNDMKSNELKSQEEDQLPAIDTEIAQNKEQLVQKQQELEVLVSSSKKEKKQEIKELRKEIEKLQEKFKHIKNRRHDVLLRLRKKHKITC